MLELSNVIADLRDELVKAQAAGAESKLHFLIDDIEIELQMVVIAEGTGKAGFKILAFGAEAQAKGSDTTTQKLKLKLKLVDKDGNSPVSISGKDIR
jgi:hypothetical protein